MPARRATVGSLVTRTVVPLLALMLVLGILGVIGVYRTNRTVNHVLDDIAPGLAANREFLQVMSDAETGVRGWAIQGEEEALEPYRAALVALPEVTATLRRYDDLRPGMAGLLDRQEQLSRQWLRSYARPRIADLPGLKGYDKTRFMTGKFVFDELRAVNARIDEEFDREGDAARETARVAYRRAVVAVILLTILAALVAWFLGRRFRRKVAGPLEGLEQTVRRQAAGDSSARARVSGPVEIAAVAEAFNALSEENERARAVESATQARLLELDHAKDDFVSNVSHELRTPLTSIRGYLEMLQDSQEEPDAATARMWTVIDRNVERLSALIEDLLALSKVESHHTTLTEVDLEDVVDDVATDLRIAAAGRHIDFVLDLPGTGVRVLADKTQLLRAFLNVVSNAVKFCRDGGRVEVRLVSDGQEATVTVRDNGIGIPAEDLSRLGSRFFRGSNAVELQIGGTGLGVRMVQAIVAKHGGTVSVESVQDEFTLVTITLPIRQQEGSETPAGE